MELELDDAYTAFRAEVREFLSRELPVDMAARNSRGFHGAQDDRKAWTVILARQGWAGPAWPVDCGGPGWDPMRVMIFEEECLLAGAPEVDVAGFRLVGPVIYTFGTEEQKQRFLEPTRMGELFWAQGFSEPGAGSDLASLTTRAVRQQDGFVVTGQKTWTSIAQHADFIFTLVKTAPEAKQRGISFLIIDAHAPGVTIRPIIDIGEGHSLNEVFFDAVHVPKENLIGEENRGWSYTKFLLDNERAFSAEVPRNKANFRRLKQFALQMRENDRRLIDDPIFAARIVQLEVDLHALEYLTLRALTQKTTGSDLPVGSMLKIRGSELMQRIGEMQIEALGGYGLIVHPEESGGVSLPGPSNASGALADFLYRRATTIYGGANEIQRGIIAKTFLGL